MLAALALKRAPTKATYLHIQLDIPGIDFVSYSESIDTTTPMGKLIFQINSAYAEFEREIIRERVISGIRAKRSKSNDEWGRPELSPELQAKIKALRAGGLSIRKTADKLKISTRTVQKYKPVNVPKELKVKL